MTEETELLIVGAGPAGASLACFLSQHGSRYHIQDGDMKTLTSPGLKGIMIAAAPGTADTPRAHITNMAALECLRDIGLDKNCLEVATQAGCMEHTRWCYSMAGEEYGRIHSWGHDPHRQGDYHDASPCEHVDIPQTLLEPILVNRAKSTGWDVRFSTSLISFKDEGEKGVVSEVKENSSGRTYKIRSRYLFGCDGGRSQVVRQLGLPLIKKPGQGLALNVYVEADLSKLVESRVGNLHWTMQPTKEFPGWSWMAIVRMVRPWNEWMFILFPPPGVELNHEPTDEEYLQRARDFIGDDTIPARLINVSKWSINEIVAERYSEGNVYCLGDAVHRHPPFNGLGSNTCIQDAYNLAWKIAYVMKGKASPTLLDSFSLERQPVGFGVISRANQGYRDHLAVWQALGMTEPTVEERTKAFNELKAPNRAGAYRREKLRTAIEGTAHEFHAVGQEMNQRYESDAVYLEDEVSRPPVPEDPVLHHQITTYPGSRLPHAWLNTRVPGNQFSTQDVAGKGRFTLFTGIGGKRWRDAAKKVGQRHGVEIAVYSIGWEQDYEDVYSDWARRREVDDDGCVLVRPDRFVAWRSRMMTDDPEEKLGSVMAQILGKQICPIPVL